MKYYKDVVQVTVIREVPDNQPDALCAGDLELIDLGWAITEGDWSGQIDLVESTELTPQQAAKELMNQGSDPGFFCLDEDGNEAIE